MSYFLKLLEKCKNDFEYFNIRKTTKIGQNNIRYTILTSAIADCSEGFV